MNLSKLEVPVTLDVTINPPRVVGDMKQGLTGSRPKMSILPRTGAIYTVRAIEYGADKYARGNYHGAPPAGVSAAERLLGYIDAAQRHLMRVSDAINRALGTGGSVAAAAGTRDEDGGGKFPASNLPDLAHAAASLMIGISCAVDDGLLPADPGQPWRAGAERGLPQKDDPAAERARVLELARSTAMITALETAKLNDSFGANRMPDEMSDGIPLPIGVTTDLYTDGFDSRGNPSKE